MSLPILEDIDQSSRRGDDDLDTLRELVDLVVPGGAAVDGQHSHTGLLRDRGEHLGDLHGELPSRHEHETQRTRRLGAIGDAVEKGDVVLVFESEKTESEVEALSSGFFRHVYVEADETVPCGTLLAAITDTADEPFDDLFTA